VQDGVKFTEGQWAGSKVLTTKDTKPHEEKPVRKGIRANSRSN
jgi:hypothetical protein